MAPQLISRGPQCLSCVRQLTGTLRETFSIPGSQQIRGKKKFAKTPAIVAVRLLQHTPTYGRKGSIIQVPPGLMRNTFYPKKLAEYVTPNQLKELGEDIVVERDRSFKLSGKAETRREKRTRLELERAAAIANGEILPEAIPETAESTIEISDILAEAVPETAESVTEIRESIPEIVNNTPNIIDSVAVEEALEVEAPVSPRIVKPEVLNPGTAINLMSKLLPSNIEFYRKTASGSDAPRRRVSPSIPVSSAISAAAAARKEAVAQSNRIRTAVSAQEIVESLKAALAKDEKGSRILLSPENITIVGQEGLQSIDQLGRFEINIALEGAPNFVRRSITISPPK
ncbi:hypothetical protein PVAG01_01480 [Phlyctema vagabunda]|uniref:Ribosomal protein L9 domain-containing protein n=1 Tax=Phlyctema vagabunda TaxID=108571 RepID=A0ABR4PYP2_9HELO